jgi:hypothetical protein
MSEPKRKFESEIKVPMLGLHPRPPKMAGMKPKSPPKPGKILASTSEFRSEIIADLIDRIKSL